MSKPKNLPEYIAGFLPTKDYKLNITFCCHDQEKRQMTALVSLQNENGEVVLAPFSQTGTYESFNGTDKNGDPAHYLNGKGGLWHNLGMLKDVIDGANNLRQLELELEEKKKLLKAEEDKLKKAPKIIGNRCAGGLDTSVLDALLTIPAGDTNHKTALEKANLQTLLKAAETLKTTKGGKSKFAKVSSEIKKITGTTAEDMGHVFDPEEAEAETEPKETGKGEEQQPHHPQQLSFLTPQGE